ncbi:NAD(P)-binding protein [Heliocybe sulcata]|uniref:NAD(P)-binding protein n=1 Tax=Heliocybe sulcata TaxID=5364 RepID=A0A5C3MVT9_9AGAM|nr:NAD(P)-binding protein [Heliocybe sulcata]TFK51158.1 NAD(P)-binding protein [Heliocybe sulcata]
MSSLHASKLADLTGRIALVTGGGTGILSARLHRGNVVARALAANGAKVYITGRRKQVLDNAASPARDGRDRQGRDPRRRADRPDPGGQAPHPRQQRGRGRPRRPPALGHRRLLPTPLRIPKLHRLERHLPNQRLRHLLPHPRLPRAPRSETASVVNISSIAALLHLPVGRYCYLTTKAALNHLSVTLATDFALQKVPVRVNVISPGPFKSELAPPMLEEALKNSVTLPGTLSPFPTKRTESALCKAHWRGSAWRRRWLCITVLSLVASGYTNGQVIALDGGASLVNP